MSMCLVEWIHIPEVVRYEKSNQVFFSYRGVENCFRLSRRLKLQGQYQSRTLVRKNLSSFMKSILNGLLSREATSRKIRTA